MNENAYERKVPKILVRVLRRMKVYCVLVLPEGKPFSQKKNKRKSSWPIVSSMKVGIEIM